MLSLSFREGEETERNTQKCHLVQNLIPWETPWAMCTCMYATSVHVCTCMCHICSLHRYVYVASVHMCTCVCATSVHVCRCVILHLCTCAHVCMRAYKGQRLMPVIILGSSYTFFPEVGPLSKAQIYPVLLAAIVTLLWVAAVSVFLQRWSMPTRPQKQKKKLYYVKCCKKWKRLVIYISKIGLSPWLFM